MLDANLALKIGNKILAEYSLNLDEAIRLALNPEDPDTLRYSMECCLDGILDENEKMDDLREIIFKATIEQFGVDLSNPVEIYNKGTPRNWTVLTGEVVKVFETNYKDLFLQVDEGDKYYFAAGGVRAK